MRAQFIEGSVGATFLIASLGRRKAITRAKLAIQAADRDGNEAAVNRWVEVLRIVRGGF